MFLLSNGHILSELGFWIFFIPTIFVLSHVVLLIIIIPQWLLDGYFDPKKRKQDRYNALESIANDLGLRNKTVQPEKNLNFFSWLVHQKKVRDYYIPYENKINKIDDNIWETVKEIKPDSIPRYFYGAIFSKQNLLDVLCTKDSSKPNMTIATRRIRKGKNNSDYYRILHLKSHTLTFPQCSIEPVNEWIDSISPNQDDINFTSDIDFSKKFDLTGENQLKIRALFNKSIREQISKKPNWKWKFENECILLKYKINAPELHNFQDIKVSLKELSQLHKKLEKSNIASEPLEAELESDNPKEIINKKLFKKRMAIFGILMGCGTAITSFSLFLLFIFFVRIDFRFFVQGIFFLAIGLTLFIYGKSEWKRNKTLKANGKVTED